MIDKRDTNMLLFTALWLIVIIWSALDGLTLFISIWGGVSLVLYIESVKQWSSYGISWEFISLFIGTVLTSSTVMIYLFAVVGLIDRQDIGPLYLAKLTPGYAGLLMYVGFQARLLRKQHQHIQRGLKRINGDDNSNDGDSNGDGNGDKS